MSPPTVPVFDPDRGTRHNQTTRWIEPMMLRRLCLSSLLIFSGCLFSSEDVDTDEPNNGSVNNISPNGTPNNVAPNNIAPNNVTPNNVTPNNVTVNGTPNNVSPNNNPACPPIPDANRCAFEYSCSPDATDECPGCGLCDGICAVPDGEMGPGAIGVCVAQTPGQFVDNEGGGAGRSVAVDDAGIYLGRPDFDPPEVMVFDDDGAPTNGRIYSNFDPSQSFAETFAASGGNVVVSCPDCQSGIGGAEIFDASSTGPAMGRQLLPNQEQLGAAVDVRAESRGLFVAVGAPELNSVFVMEDLVASGIGSVQLAGAPESGMGHSVALGRNRLVTGQTNPPAVVVWDRSALRDYGEEARFGVDLGLGDGVAMGPAGVKVAAIGGDNLGVFVRNGPSDWNSVDFHTLGRGAWVSVAVNSTFVYGSTDEGKVHAFVNDGDELWHIGTLQYSGEAIVAASESRLVVATPEDPDASFYIVKLQPTLNP